MAIYHLHVKNIGRSEGRSAVAAAAYRAGETLPNEAEERDSAFGGRRDVVFTQIILPAGAPAWMADRARLWNAAEAAEKRKDARLAKEIEFALPRELPREMWAEVAREMADVYASRGHVVDLAIHDDGAAHNPHVHLMLATRAVTGDGFGGKLRAADGKVFVVEARALWAKVANAALGRVGAAVQVDARSHAARDIDRPPARHRGPDPAERRARRRDREEGGRMTDEPQDASKAPRMLTPEEEREYPVPGPDRRPISPDELDEAQDRMVAEMERPAREVPQAPRPERREVRPDPPRDPPQVRFTARENHLDWTARTDGADRDPPAVAIRARADYLDWTRREDPEPDRADGPERERER